MITTIRQTLTSALRSNTLSSKTRQLSRGSRAHICHQVALRAHRQRAVFELRAVYSPTFSPLGSLSTSSSLGKIVQRSFLTYSDEAAADKLSKYLIAHLSSTHPGSNPERLCREVATCRAESPNMRAEKVVEALAEQGEIEPSSALAKELIVALGKYQPQSN
jgi:hypothetical protein